MSAATQYDAAGNLKNDGRETFNYDATGQQTYASTTALTQGYDGDRLRVKRVENGVTTLYVRSSMLGGQVLGELSSTGVLSRSYVYLGGQMLAIQESSQVKWVHQDPVTKSQRLTNSSGTVVSVVDLDPWGAETSRSSQEQLQPHRYTSYERDANEGDEAQQRRYQAWWTRFSQPDPFDGSYDLTDPQSFNRYSYVSNDPVNMVDPSGLDEVVRVYSWARAPRWGPFDASMGGFSGIMRHYTENEPFFIAPLWLNRDRESSAEPQQPASNNEGQPLSDCVKNLLAKYFDRNLLDAIRIHNNSRVPPKMGGYTYKDNVYFKGQNNQHSRVEIAELGHEIEHAQQYRTHTFFLAQYFLDVLGMHSHPILGPIVEGDMIFGSGSIGHDMNRFEKPAMKRERQINTDLANKDTPCP